MNDPRPGANNGTGSEPGENGWARTGGNSDPEWVSSDRVLEGSLETLRECRKTISDLEALSKTAFCSLQCLGPGDALLGLWVWGALYGTNEVVKGHDLGDLVSPKDLVNLHKETISELAVQRLVHLQQHNQNLRIRCSPALPAAHCQPYQIVMKSEIILGNLERVTTKLFECRWLYPTDQGERDLQILRLIAEAQYLRTNLTNFLLHLKAGGFSLFIDRQLDGLRSGATFKMVGGERQVDLDNQMDNFYGCLRTAFGYPEGNEILSLLAEFGLNHLNDILVVKETRSQIRLGAVQLRASPLGMDLNQLQAKDLFNERVKYLRDSQTERVGACLERGALTPIDHQPAVKESQASTSTTLSYAQAAGGKSAIQNKGSDWTLFSNVYPDPSYSGNQKTDKGTNAEVSTKDEFVPNVVKRSARDRLADGETVFVNLVEAAEEHVRWVHPPRDISDALYTLLQDTKNLEDLNLNPKIMHYIGGLILFLRARCKKFYYYNTNCLICQWGKVYENGAFPVMRGVKRLELHFAASHQLPVEMCISLSRGFDRREQTKNEKGARREEKCRSLSRRDSGTPPPPRDQPRGRESGRRGEKGKSWRGDPDDGPWRKNLESPSSQSISKRKHVDQKVADLRETLNQSAKRDRKMDSGNDECRRSSPTDCPDDLVNLHNEGCVEGALICEVAAENGKPPEEILTETSQGKTENEDLPLREMFGQFRQEMAEQMRLLRESQVAGASGLVVPNLEREGNGECIEKKAEPDPEEVVEDRGLPMEISEAEGDHHETQQGMRGVDELSEFELDVLLGPDDGL